MARAIPVDLGIVNPNGCWLGSRQGVGIGISAVSAHHDYTHGSRQCKEQTYVWLVDVWGILGAQRSSGGARLDSSQYMRVLRVPRGLMMQFQWERNTVAPGGTWHLVGQDKVRQRRSASGERQVVSIPRRARDPK
jgi:hypothetical protein